MTGWRKRQVADMAKEVKMPYDFVTGEPINLEKLEAFAELVRADEALAQPAPVQKPVAWVEYETGNNTKRPQNCGTGYCSCIECVMEPAQRTWVGLMRGVRVDGDTVVITVKGGNDAARELCGDLLNEMEVRRGND
jgi:hypothetical protein